MKPIGILLTLLGVLALCLFFMFQEEQPDGRPVLELEVHCAAVLQRPVEAIARQYEQEYGVKIKLNFGGSGQLYTKLKVAGGDLYLPADKSYTDKAEDEGLVAKVIPISKLTAGLIVAKGNPKNIRELSDLTRDDVRVVIAARSAAVGLFTHQVLESAGILEEVELGAISKVGSVSEVALQVDLGASDVGVVWDVLMPLYQQSELVRVAEFNQQTRLATVAVLKSSKHEAEALKFAHFLTAKNKGAVTFEKHGFVVK